MTRPDRKEIEHNIRKALHKAGFEAYATHSPKFTEPTVENLIPVLADLQDEQWRNLEAAREEARNNSRYGIGSDGEYFTSDDNGDQKKW